MDISRKQKTCDHLPGALSPADSDTVIVTYSLMRAAMRNLSRHLYAPRGGETS